MAQDDLQPSYEDLLRELRGHLRKVLDMKIYFDGEQKPISEVLKNIFTISKQRGFSEDIWAEMDEDGNHYSITGNFEQNTPIAAQHLLQLLTVFKDMEKQIENLAAPQRLVLHREAIEAIMGTEDNMQPSSANNSETLATEYFNIYRVFRQMAKNESSGFRQDLTAKGEAITDLADMHRRADRLRAISSHAMATCRGLRTLAKRCDQIENCLSQISYRHP